MCLSLVKTDVIQNVWILFFFFFSSVNETGARTFLFRCFHFVSNAEEACKTWLSTCKKSLC